MESLERRFVLVTDLDHTLVRHRENETHEDLLAFNEIWQQHFRHDSLLIYSTGRSPFKYMQLRDAVPLMTPDVLVCSVGTEIYWRQENGSFIPDHAWIRQLDEDWMRDQILEVAAKLDTQFFTLQVESEQRRHKISFTLQNTPNKESHIEQLRRSLLEKGIQAQVVFSGGQDVDILPIHAGKGPALSSLLNQMRVEGKYPSKGVLVNGDSGNDIDLFKVDGVRGCIVANALPELNQWADQHQHDYTLFRATQPCASGIVEALKHYELIQEGDSIKKHPFGALANIVEGRLSEVKFLADSFSVQEEDEEVEVGKDLEKLRGLLEVNPANLLFIDGLKAESEAPHYNLKFHLCWLHSTPEGVSRTNRSAILKLSLIEHCYQWNSLTLSSPEPPGEIC